MNKSLLLFLSFFCQALIAQEANNAIEKTLSSVVTIALFELSENDAVFGFGEAERQAEIAYREALDLSGAASSGSGFVIEYKGESYIVTNAHVVDGAAQNPEAIGVFDLQRRKYAVELIGGDSFYDLAVLAFTDEVNAADFPVLKFAKNPARLTEKVYAIGNPLGKYPYSITDGIVSGKNRIFQNPTTGKYGFLQHTATLIWGNSGGPLVNEKGEIVGVNTWIGTDAKGSQQYIFSQLNFAIEANLVQQLVGEIIENNGRVTRPFLGIEFATRKDFLGMNSPPFIQNILPNSPAAEKLSSKKGYFITAINQEKVRTLQDILRILEQTSPEKEVQFVLKKEQPDFANGRTSFGETEKITLKTGDLSVSNLEKIAQHFFTQYADYQTNTQGNALLLSKKPDRAKPRIEKITVANQSATFELSTGADTYTILASGLFDKWGRPTLYRTQSLSDLGAVIRLCSLEGHLSASVSGIDEKIENIRFYLQDEDFNELRVLYY